MVFCMDEARKLDYLNGMLSEKESTLFEEHLAACPGCRQEIVELRKTAAAVAGLEPPSVPAAWTAAAKERLRAKISPPLAAVPSGPAPTRRRTNALQYAVIAACVTTGFALLFWFIIGGLGMPAPRAARTVHLVTWILSLHTLVLIPSIIDSVYRLLRRAGRKSRPASSAGFSTC